MVSMVLIIPVLVVVLIVFLVVGFKTESEEEGGEEMIKNVYIYLVLFATLMMTIGGSVGTFMAVADIIAPAPYHQSFEEYQRWGPEKPRVENGAEEPQMSETELKEQYDAMVSTEKARQVNRAKNSLIKSFGWIIIPLPVFIYFQRRLIKKDS